MSNYTFNQPSEMIATEYHRFVKPATMENHLLLILSVDGKREVFDSYKKDNVMTVEVTLVDLDGAKVPQKVRWQQTGLVNRLNVGEKNILVRLGKIQTKKGFPAWNLNAHKPEDTKVATLWLEEYNKPTVSNIEEPVEEPTKDAWDVDVPW